MRNKKKKAVPDIQDCRDGKGTREHRLAADVSLMYWRQKAEVSKGRSGTAAMLSHECYNFELASTANGILTCVTGILACVNLQRANTRQPQRPRVAVSDEHWFPKPSEQQTPASSRVFLPPVFFNIQQVTAFKLSWTRPRHPRFTGFPTWALHSPLRGSAAGRPRRSASAAGPGSTGPGRAGPEGPPQGPHGSCSTGCTGPGTPGHRRYRDTGTARPRPARALPSPLCPHPPPSLPRAFLLKRSMTTIQNQR